MGLLPEATQFVTHGGELVGPGQTEKKSAGDLTQLFCSDQVRDLNSR